MLPDTSPRLVIFDCDGVLIDSEPMAREVVAAEATRLGWRITPKEAHEFTGLRWSDLQPVFERRSGLDLPETWPVAMQDALIARMRGHGIQEVAGAAAILRNLRAIGLPYRVASNSSHEEMAEKFAATGLTDLVAGCLHSARDVGIGKPAPDLFLAAAAAEGTAPAHCIVIEDSGPGIAAAHAAGMRCVAYAPNGGPVPTDTWRRIAHLSELEALLGGMAQDRAA